MQCAGGTRVARFRSRRTPHSSACSLAIAPLGAPIARRSRCWPKLSAGPRPLTSLPLLGPHVEEFAVWLRAQGYPLLPLRLRIRETPRLDARLRRRGVRRLEDLSVAQLLGLAPRDSQDDICRAALARSLARYLDVRGVLVRPVATPPEQMVAAYRACLERVRGLADSTVTHHCATASALLAFLGFDGDAAILRHLGPRQLEGFLRTVGTRIGRASLQHTVAHVRSFLRFLASRGDIGHGLDASIDTPRLYRGGAASPGRCPGRRCRLSSPRSTERRPMGRRDYAMFLLVATYGLRTSEVAGLRLEDIEWRAGRLRVPRPKTQTPIAFP